MSARLRAQRAAQNAAINGRECGCVWGRARSAKAHLCHPHYLLAMGGGEQLLRLLRRLLRPRKLAIRVDLRGARLQYLHQLARDCARITPCEHCG
eukprot:4636821-Prymnesium_polylepis.1